MRLDWNNLTVELGSFGYSRWPNGVICVETWKKRIIPDNDLWIFDTGSGTMNMVERVSTLHKNTILWMRPGHDYEVRQNPDDPIGMLFFHFHLILPDGSRLFPDTRQIPEVLECFNHAYWQAMGRNLLRIVQLKKTVSVFNGVRMTEQLKDIDQTAAAMFKSMLMGIDLCENYLHHEQVESRNALLAIQAAEYLSEHNKTFISINDVAGYFHICHNDFTRFFTEFWHCTPQQFQILQRMQQAKNLLEHTDNTLAEIAEQLGYADHYFFSRQFKQQTGMTPGNYRKSIKDKLTLTEQGIEND